MPDGKLTSLDNRRLACIKNIVRNNLNPKLSVPVIIYDHTAFATDKYLTPISRDLNSRSAAIGSVALTTLAQKNKIDFESFGYCTYARMRVFNPMQPDDDLYGFVSDPVVRMKSLEDS